MTRLKLKVTKNKIKILAKNAKINISESDKWKEIEIKGCRKILALMNGGTCFEGDKTKAVDGVLADGTVFDIKSSGKKSISEIERSMEIFTSDAQLNEMRRNLREGKKPFFAVVFKNGRIYKVDFSEIDTDDDIKGGCEEYKNPKKRQRDEFRKETDEEHRERNFRFFS